MNEKVRPRLLFVDDEPQVLKMLQLMLKSMSGEWDLEFAGDGADALSRMEARSFDIIVSDMRMPGMNGAELLNEVMKRHPRTARIILSGYADEDLVMRCIGSTHHYLVKPFDLALLKATLKRINTLNDRLNNESLRKLVGSIRCLPSVPEVYVQIIEALQQPDCPIQSIAEMIARDVALTSKVLQLVNSAFFGFARNVASVDEAVQILGVGIVRSLALTVKVFAQFEGSSFTELSVDQVWHHSLRTGALARKIAEAEHADGHVLDQSFTAGLLHDVGKLILATGYPDKYREVLIEARDNGWGVFQLEQKAFKSTHAEVGGYLLGLWGLPTPLVEAVLLHHTPSASGATSFCPLTAVHVANVLAHEHLLPGSKSFLARLDSVHLTSAGLMDRVDSWRALIDG